MNRTRRAARAALAIGMLGAAATAQALEPAPVAMPPVGTKLHYDDGGTPRTWIVTEAKPGSYAAERGDQLASFATIGGLISPAHNYRDERGFTGWQKVVSGDPLSIYPLKVGNAATYALTGAAPSRGWTWNQQYACNVTGTERVKVAVGEHDTYVVHCVRSGPRGKEQTVTRYYAPALGLTIRSITVDHVNNNRWNTDLLKIEKP